jgi:hypothetical protein
MDSRGALLRRSAADARSSVRGGAPNQCRHGPAATRRLAPPGQTADAAGPVTGGALHPGDRHAGRLQHDLAGAGAPPRGRIVTLEADPIHAQAARINIARADLSDAVDLRVGLALETLPQIEADGRGPFDLVFIDADKRSNVDYFAWALRLSRPGSLIVIDNVVRDGAVADEDSQDTSVQGVRRLAHVLAAEPRVSATAIQTVGSKGYDGFVLARVSD